MIEVELNFRTQGNATSYLREGFSVPEASGTWMTGRRSVIVLPPPPRPSARYTLRLVVSPFLHAGVIDEQPFDIYINDALVYATSLRGGTEIRRQISGERIGIDRNVMIEFRHPAAAFPVTLSPSGDTRELAASIWSLVITGESDRAGSDVLAGDEPPVFNMPVFEMPVFEIRSLGNLGNRMIEYMVALAVQARVPECVLSGVELDEWGLRTGFRGPAWADVAIHTEQHIDVASVAEMLRGRVTRKVAYSGYGQRLENFPPLDTCRNAFTSPIVDVDGYDQRYLVINVRSGDVVPGRFEPYPLLPAAFYRDLVAETGLVPVFMGQVEPNAYTDLLREAFPDALFVPSQGPLRDFETVRRSRNIVISVSTFSWLAAWLSHADRIFMPVNGLFNPLHFPAVDLLPLHDPRYRFYLFPANRPVPPDQLREAHAQLQGRWARIAPDALAARLGRTRRPDLHAALAGGAEPTEQDQAARAEAEDIAAEPLPLDPAAIVELGFALHKRGERDRAEQVFRRGTQTAPKDAWLRFGLSVVLSSQHRTAEALAEIEVAAGLDAGSHHVQAHHGMLLSASGALEEAEAAFGRALQIDPRNPDRHVALASVLAQQGRFADALAAAERAVALLPEDASVISFRDRMRAAQAARSASAAARRGAVAAPAVRTGSVLPTLAVVTMVYNEADILPLWLRHYGRVAGPENCFVVDHGSDDGSTAGIGPASVIRIPRSPLDDARRTAAMADLVASLLRWYNVVAYTDSDEMLVADPALFPTLRHYCAAAQQDTMTCFGMNVVHQAKVEPALRFDLPVSQQRRSLLALSPMAKPLLTRVPVQWSPGFHSYDGPPVFDGLFNFHLPYVDQERTLRRQAKRRSAPIAGNPDPSKHHHLFGDDWVLRSFEAYSQFSELTDVKLDDSCRAYKAFVNEILASYEIYKDNFYKINMHLWNTVLWRLPERFVGTF